MEDIVTYRFVHFFNTNIIVLMVVKIISQITEVLVLSLWLNIKQLKIPPPPPKCSSTVLGQRKILELLVATMVAVLFDL